MTKRELSFEAIKKRCNRAYFADQRNIRALVDCREDYLKACWDWLYGKGG